MNEDLSYIMFVLIGDNFEISQYLRQVANDWGMDVAYDICKPLAQAFMCYDKLSGNLNNISQYDSLEKFLVEFKEKIVEYFNGEDDYEYLTKIVRSKKDE